MTDAYEARRTRLRSLMAERDLPAVLVTKLVNVRYLTGFSGSNGAVLITPDEAVLATDGRYKDQAAEEAPGVELLIERAVATALATRAATAGRLGVETHDVAVDTYNDVLKSAEDAEVVSLARAVEKLREVKDASELEALRAACRISVEALAALVVEPLVGRSEREIARDLEWRMFGLGAEAIAFDTIVAAGENSAIPHHQPTDREVRRGDLLKIDFGARVAGYHADCTRTFVVGEPADWQVEVHSVVARAQEAGRLAIVPGATSKTIDDAARNTVKAAGYGEEFTHGLGHGVGLEIHEDPFLHGKGEDVLQPRIPVTVEPGVYLPGRGGVRIEDTTVLNDDGVLEVLTDAPRELIVVG